MERYRNGYNGAVLKTDVPRKRLVGSNPTLSAIEVRRRTNLLCQVIAEPGRRRAVRLKRIRGAYLIASLSINHVTR